MDPGTAYLVATLVGGGMNLLGGTLSGAGQQKMTEADRAHQIKMFLSQMGVDLDKFDALRRDQQGQTGLSVTQQTPNRVGWRQDQAVRAAVMPELRNASVSSGIPGMNSFIPQMSGGLRIPEGGFSPSTLKFFGDKAMLAGEYDLDKAGMVASGGQMPIPSYTSVYGAGGLDQEGGLGAISTRLKAEDEERARKRREALTRSLSPTSLPGVGVDYDPYAR